MLKLLVFGTSNCFPGSAFIRGLERVCVVKNCSLGASTSVLAAISIELINFSEYDFCLLDFAINEDSLLTDGGRIERFEYSAEAIAAQAWSQGCIPIILVFPTKNNRAKPSRMGRRYLELARSWSVPFIDLRIVLEAVCIPPGPTFDDVFKDELHLAWWFVSELATFLVAALDGLRGRSGESLNEEWEYRPLRAIPLPDVASSSFVVTARSSSALSGTFVKIPRDQILHVPLNHGEVAVGLVVNYKECTGILSLKGDEFLDVDLRSKYLTWPGTLIVVAIHLPRELSPQDGSVALVTIAPPGLHEGGLGEIAVEVSHLIVRNEEVITVQRRPATSLHVDLWRDMPKNLQEDFTTALAAWPLKLKELAPK